MPGKQMDFQEKALSTLIKNAYDFLDAALANFERDTKRSVIDFYTAVELFLKAPLLNEHWSLIVVKEPNFHKFKKGDFSSIGLNDTIKRLSEVLETKIELKTIQAFNNVRKHRNQYVHLFIDEDPEKLATIALEQSQAWAHLHRLITNEFADVFKSYSEKNEEIEGSLRRNLNFWHEHARLKLETLKDLISTKRDAGAMIQACHTCNTDSVITEESNPFLYESKCLVCDSYKRSVGLTCPHCSKEITLSEGYDFCIPCGHRFTPEELYPILDTYAGRQKELFTLGLPASCNFCESTETVCEFHDDYLCASCFALTENLTQCEYCHTSLNYKGESTYAIGCGFCSGAMGD